MTMDDTTPLLSPGDKFRDRLFCRSNVEPKKGNGPDIKMVLIADGHRYPAKKWTVPDEEKNFVKASQFLLASGIVDKGGAYEGEITLDAVKPVPEDQIPQDLEPYLSAQHIDHDEHIARFERLVESVENPALHKLLIQFFEKDKPYWSDYSNAAAAEKMHHAYRGGLLHHSVEVAELCAATCTVISTLNRDLLVTCALLHDVGKIKEMEQGVNSGDYTPNGILLGHVVEGVLMLRPFMSQKIIAEFSNTLRETVTHMILSHHGCLEFGAVKLPAFAEAFVLSQCDMTSAKICQYNEAKTEKLEWLRGRDGVRCYSGSLGLEEAEFADS